MVSGMKRTKGPCYRLSTWLRARRGQSPRFGADPPHASCNACFNLLIAMTKRRSGGALWRRWDRLERIATNELDEYL